MSSAFTKQYGLEYPIVQAALGVISMPPLVAAVSEAGAMGTLGAVGEPLMSPRLLRRSIAAVQRLTARPFGVNFVTPFVTEHHLRVCIEAGVPVVSFHLRAPPPKLIELLHANQVRAWVQVGSAALAREAVQAGADAVIAQGSEAGGRNRSVSTLMTLVPAILEAVAPVPVLAAGGIADGRGLAAALALGAQAAWIGTRFLASREANAHPEYKQRIIAAAEGATELTTIFGENEDDPPIRALRNRIVAEWTGRCPDLERRARSDRVIGQTELGERIVPLSEFSNLLPTPETSGDVDEMCLPAGETAALVREICSAGQIVRTMMKQARQATADAFAAITVVHARS